MSDKTHLPQDPIPVRQLSGVDKDILSALIETKAVNFEALGQTIGRVGGASVFTDDGWIRWCGSDMRIFRWPRPRLDLEELGAIRDVLRGPAG